jgi:RNA polymerase sigma-70 factor (ECF subfamily)
LQSWLPSASSAPLDRKYFEQADSFHPLAGNWLRMTDTEFREVFRSHKDVVFRFAYRMTGSTPSAEDVVQDVFVALWRKPQAYQADRGSIRSFLIGVARNLILKRWRRDRPYESLEEETMPLAHAPGTGFDHHDAVARAVSALPPLQREAVVLAEFEEMSLDEIARATGVELPAVKSRLQRGRENLRRMLAPLLESKGSTHGTQR